MKPQNYTREDRKLEWARFAAPLSAVVAVVAVVVMISWPQPQATLAKATPAPRSSAVLAVPASTGHAAESLPLLRAFSELDLLRDNATLGDPIAGVTLVRQLLDSFERTGRGDDLYEAVQWIDRGWAEGHYQSSGLPTRIFEQYCDYGALRWHWLCDHGE